MTGVTSPTHPLPRKDFPPEDGFASSLLEFEIWNLGCGCRLRYTSVVKRFFQNSSTAPVGTVRTPGVSEALSSTTPVRLLSPYFSGQSPQASCRFNRVNLDQRR